MTIFVNFTKASKTAESFCLFSPSPIIIRKSNKCKKLITPYILKSHVHVEVTLDTSGDVLSTVNNRTNDATALAGYATMMMMMMSILSLRLKQC